MGTRWLVMVVVSGSLVASGCGRSGGRTVALSDEPVTVLDVERTQNGPGFFADEVSVTESAIFGVDLEVTSGAPVDVAIIEATKTSHGLLSSWSRGERDMNVAVCNWTSTREINLSCRVPAGRYTIAVRTPRYRSETRHHLHVDASRP